MSPSGRRVADMAEWPTWPSGRHGRVADMAEWPTWPSGRHGRVADMAEWPTWPSGRHGRVADMAEWPTWPSGRHGRVADMAEWPTWPSGRHGRVADMAEWPTWPSGRHGRVADMAEWPTWPSGRHGRVADMAEWPTWPSGRHGRVADMAEWPTWPSGRHGRVADMAEWPTWPSGRHGRVADMAEWPTWPSGRHGRVADMAEYLDGGSITTSYGAVKQAYKSTKQDRNAYSQIEDIMIGLLTVLVFAMLTSPLAIFHVVERVTKFLHQQSLTAVSGWMLYSASILYDTITFLVMTALITVAFHIGGWAQGQMLRVLIVFILYFVASLPSVYLLASFFTSAPRANSLITIYQTMGAYGSLLIISIVQSFTNWDPKILATILDDSDVVKEREIVDAHSGKFALEVNTLVKHYGHFTALNRLTFAMKEAECFGLLGVNGAGKTTTFGILTGEIFASSGSAFLGNQEITGILTMGYCPQFDAYLQELTGKEVLWILATLYGYKYPAKKAHSILRAVLMEENGKKQLKHCSGGQKRKISVGIALLARSTLIILDEPTAGIDPRARREIWSLIGVVRDIEKRAVLLCSHSMDECEALCTRVGILVRGHLRAIGTTQHLKSKFGNSYQLMLVYSNEEVNRTEIPEEVKRSFPGATLHSDGIQGNVFRFTIPRQEGDRWSSLWERGGVIALRTGAIDYSLAQNTLTQTFLTLSGQQEENL
ncbi:unnamed protein product, partial [Mesorhabditis belari]|uniref:ABC transporter domain-containing protein n=1 Tax=Mesorhabditis belari TaxID=2138241 RepID=A0AAF3EB35_9BILA